MNKKILITIAIFLSMCCIVHSTKMMAKEDGKVQIWSTTLDERVEHRSLEVGDSNPNFQIRIIPEGTKFTNVSWSTSDSEIATVSGNSSNATVYGRTEGSTKFKLSVDTNEYGNLNYDCIISVYTKINNVAGEIKKATTLYRGADSSSWVRTKSVKAGQALTIIGSCGQYYYVVMPDEYVFDDNRSKRETYVLKSDVYVPVDSIDLDKDNLVFRAGDSGRVEAEILPEIASDKSYHYKSSNENVAFVDNGVIKSKREGFSTITASTISGSKESRCNVSVYTPINPTKGRLAKNTKLYVGADEKCDVKKSDAKKGENLQVIGKCGKYYYVKFAENYFGAKTDNKAFVLISDVYVPVEKIELSETNLILNINQTAKLTVKIYPEIATNKKVEFHTALGAISVNSEGVITVNQIKDDNIYATGSDGKSSHVCGVQVLRDKIIEKLDPKNKFKVSTLKTDLDGNYVTFSECWGASEYIVFRSDGKQWEDIYYAYNNDSKAYRYVFDAGAQLGKTYQYKIIAYYKYVTYKEGKLVTERVTKTIYSDKIKTGLPQMKGKVIKNKKGTPEKIKLTWKKMSYDYNGGTSKGGYVISRKIGSKKTEIIKMVKKKKTTTYTDKKIKKNKKYTYYIKAFYVNKLGKKVYSPTKEIIVNTKK